MTTQKIQLAIKATPEQVWTALTDGSVTPAYYFGYVAEYGNLTPGNNYRYTAGGGEMITGRIESVVHGRTLSATFNGHWAPDVDALPESRVTFEVSDPFMPMPGVTFLSCRHEDLPDGETAANIETGWVSILSGLKSLLETGAPMTSPPAT